MKQTVRTIFGKDVFAGCLSSLNTYLPVIPEGKKTSSDDKYFGIVIRKYGLLWVKMAELDPTVALTWVTGTGNDVKINDEYMIRFLSHLFECHEDGEIGQSIYDDALKAIQWFLNMQLELSKASRRPGHVRNMAGVATMTEKVKTSRSTSARIDMEDLQSDQDETLTMAVWNQIAAFLLACVVVSGFNETPMMFFMTGIAMLVGRALAARGEDLRGIVLGGLAVQFYEGIGPKGTRVLTIVSREGKLNRSGRRTRNGIMAHRNPRLCALNFIGLSLIFRWCCLTTDPMPSWKDGEYASLFTPIFRSPSSGKVPMNYDKHNSIVAGILAYFGVVAAMVTHFMRGDSARFLENHQVNSESVKRHMNRVNEAHANSYATGVQVEAVATLAGYNANNLQAASAPHLRANEGLDQAVNLVLPSLSEAESDVAGGIELANNNQQTMKQNRLFMRKASVQAVRFLIGVAIQCALARPRTGDGLIDFDSEPMHQLYQKNPVYQYLTSIGFFRNPVILALAARIREEEEREQPMQPGGGLGQAGDDAAGSGADTSPTTARVAQFLRPELERNANFCATVLSQLGELKVLFASARVPSPSGQSESSSPNSNSSSSSSSSSTAAMATATNSGGALPPPLPGPRPDEAPVSGMSRAHYANPAEGHAVMEDLGQHKSAQSLFNEWKKVKDRCPKSRSYKGGSDKYYKRGPMFRLFEREMAKGGGSEATAVAALHSVVVQAGSRGRSSAPDWKKVKSILDEIPEERELKKKRKDRAEDNKRAKRKVRRAPVDAADLVVQFHSDGITQVADGEAPPRFPAQNDGGYR